MSATAADDNVGIGFGRVLAVVAAVLAIVGSLVPWVSTGRIVVAIAVPFCMVALVREVVPMHTTPTWSVSLGFGLLAWLHIVTTGDTARWMRDSHMVSWVPLPGEAWIVGFAWACLAAWIGLFLTCAWTPSNPGWHAFGTCPAGRRGTPAAGRPKPTAH